LQQIEIDANRVAVHSATQNRKRSKGFEIVLSAVDGAEMRSRFDMPFAPPDILITNYSMLSIMLMRDIDRCEKQKVVGLRRFTGEQES
jgi:ATP-dependent helicase YprA (DUF1998 family)